MESKITIHFWQGNGFIGRSIRFFTWGRFSHVGMQVGSFLYEAREFRGVVKSRWPDAKRPSPTESLSLAVTEHQKMAMFNWWQERLGWPYDYLSVFRFITRRPETESTRRKFFCSEAVVECCEAAGIKLFERVDASKIAPTWVYRSPILTR